MKKRKLGILLFLLLSLCFGSTTFAASNTQPYYLTVNLTDNIVTVYGKDTAGNYTVPLRAFACSGGTETPVGTFHTTVKYDWRALFGNVWGQYATRITGSILFHSVPYYKKDKSTLEYDEYNKLGTTASAGCIRLSVQDAKWIYDNCPIGTTVKMYRGKVQEPLQPATPQKIDRNDTQRRGWDPTDPDPANPWNKSVIRNFWIQSVFVEGQATLYSENGVYYASAADAKEIFACLHRDITLPTEAATQSPTVLSDNGTTAEVHWLKKDGVVYYKLRDLTNLFGATLSWNSATEEMDLGLGGATIRLKEGPEIKVTATLPTEAAAVILRNR